MTGQGDSRHRRLGHQSNDIGLDGLHRTCIMKRSLHPSTDCPPKQGSVEVAAIMFGTK
jgi:hypothetical protein